MSKSGERSEVNENSTTELLREDAQKPLLDHTENGDHENFSKLLKNRENLTKENEEKQQDTTDEQLAAAAPIVTPTVTAATAPIVTTTVTAATAPIVTTTDTKKESKTEESTDEEKQKDTTDEQLAAAAPIVTPTVTKEESTTEIKDKEAEAPKKEAFTKEDFFAGKVQNLDFIPGKIPAEFENKFRKDNTRPLSDESVSHVEERANSDGSYHYTIKVVEPDSPTRIHKVEGDFGTLYFDAKGSMIGADLTKDAEKLKKLDPKQREEAEKLIAENEKSRAKASSIDAADLEHIKPDLRASLTAKAATTPSAPTVAPAKGPVKETSVSL